MTATIVVPTSFSTRRRDLHDAVLAMLEAFTTAYPTYVRINHHNLPTLRTGEGPFVYISGITETLIHDTGTRVTLFRGSFAYVDTLTDPDDTDDRVNLWADYMRDLCTANARMLPPGIFVQTGLREIELPEGGPAPLANVVLEWEFTIQEGRTL